MADPVVIDRSVISWLIGAAGAFILYLLSLGVKDLRDKMRKVDQLCIRLERLEQRVDSELGK
jgi:hypothetical protein